MNASPIRWSSTSQNASGTPEPDKPAAKSGGEIDDLKRELDEMRRKVDKLTGGND